MCTNKERILRRECVFVFVLTLVKYPLYFFSVMYFTHPLLQSPNKTTKTPHWHVKFWRFIPSTPNVSNDVFNPYKVSWESLHWNSDQNSSRTQTKGSGPQTQPSHWPKLVIFYHLHYNTFKTSDLKFPRTPQTEVRELYEETLVVYSIV